MTRPRKTLSLKIAEQIRNPLSFFSSTLENIQTISPPLIDVNAVNDRLYNAKVDFMITTALIGIAPGVSGTYP
ncbi:MAG: hypothetical protein AAGB46_19145 [Verrucomicrobiota bacterium]